MDRVSSLLPKVLAQRGLATQGKASLVVLTTKRWIETKLPAVFSDTRITTYSDGILTIETLTQVALTEVSAMREILSQFLAKECSLPNPPTVRVLRAR